MTTRLDIEGKKLQRKENKIRDESKNGDGEQRKGTYFFIGED